MYTLIELDKTCLLDYQLWEDENKGNWTIASYLNQFYDLNTALAFSKLYFPDFIIRKGCIILKFRFDESIFIQWEKEFNGDISSIERSCNLYEVGDYFHINLDQFEFSDSLQKSIDELARILKKAWEINCKLLFPDRKIIVDIFKEDEKTYLTLYSRGS